MHAAGTGTGDVAPSACARAMEGLGDWESGRASGASDVASSACVCVALRRSAVCAYNGVTVAMFAKAS
jgi:hypothetical protein